MRDYLKFYIDGAWTDPIAPRPFAVVNPATEEIAGHISLGSEADVDAAVAAARHAFDTRALPSQDERLALLKSVLAEYKRRQSDVAAAITEEMGAPKSLATQAAMGAAHLSTAIDVLASYTFERARGTTLIAKEPIGVCALITPWNWPINQIASKVAPALATGCTMVLKPSEIAPFSAYILAEILDAAGVPPGVFNLVNGDGPTVGRALCRHPDVDMVSFTGSTRAGVDVAREAAPTIKRVHQELGGKSPNIVLDDADITSVVAQGVKRVMVNSGQSCNAPTRMLVPQARMADAIAAARDALATVTVGSPADDVAMGPVASEAQWDKIQALIESGIADGATLVGGGAGRPAGLERGFYVRPTVFADVDNGMRIAREEIFGPVLVIIGYDDEDQAVELANDTPYGLAAYIQSGDLGHARSIMRRVRAGQVFLNYAAADLWAPFGGYKQSGNGREWGDHAFAEYLEVKAVLGFEAA